MQKLADFVILINQIEHVLYLTTKSVNFLVINQQILFMLPCKYGLPEQ